MHLRRISNFLNFGGGNCLYRSVLEREESRIVPFFEEFFAEFSAAARQIIGAKAGNRIEPGRD
jgi:hypothetical protein